MKALFIALAAAIAISIILGIVYFSATAKSQAAIIEVFHEQGRDADAFQSEIRTIGPKRQIPQLKQYLREYSQAIQSINYSSCPTDFKEAWFNYTSAVQDMSDENFTANGLKEFIEIVMSAYTKDGKLTEDAIQANKAPDRVRYSFRQCQRIAIAHGVSFHPIKPDQD